MLRSREVRGNEVTPPRRRQGAHVRNQVLELYTSCRAAWRTAVFVFKVFPMLWSRPFDWVTRRPVVERFGYASSHGPVEADLYRPARKGPHPALLVCLGVVPFGVEHPQVPRLGEALARAGFAALLYWSPSMRDFRLDPVDVSEIATAYEALLSHPAVDATRSGLIGTCVGGAFALMAAGDERVRARIAFILAYAPYASMRTFMVDIASASRPLGLSAREPWDVDPLTRKVYVHSLTALLEPDEAAILRSTFVDGNGRIEANSLSADGRDVLRLLMPQDADLAQNALDALPDTLKTRLTALSPTAYLGDILADTVVLLHDRDDPVIPVAESRSLRDALSALRTVRYTEFTVFRHLDPTKGNASPLALARELVRFAAAIYPAFRAALSDRPLGDRAS